MLVLVMTDMCVSTVVLDNGRAANLSVNSVLIKSFVPKF